MEWQASMARLTNEANFMELQGAKTYFMHVPHES
jgi:hypothetical protein